MSANKARQIRGVDAENLLVRFEGEDKPARIFDSSTTDGSSLPFAELRRIHKFIGGSDVLGTDGRPTGNPSKRNVVESIRDELLDDSFDDRFFGSELVHIVDGDGSYDPSIDSDNENGEESDGEGESDQENDDDGTDGESVEGADDDNEGSEDESEGEGSEGDGESDDDDSESDDGEESEGESSSDSEDGEEGEESEGDPTETEEIRDLSPIEEQIKDMIDEFGGDAELDEDRVREIAREEDEILESSILTTIDKTIDRVTERATEAAEKVISNYVSQSIEIKIDSFDVGSIDADDNTHEVFESIVRVLAGNQGSDVEGSIRAERNHLWIYGPAGTGKSYVVKQAAKALDLEFESMSVGPTDNYSKMFGFVDANSNYVTTPIREAVEHGRVMLIDEVDNGSADVNNSLNMLLALSVGDVMNFPDGPVRVAEGFVACCTANTRGDGSDGMYKRNVQDGAFKSRFIYLEMGIDELLEEKISAQNFREEGAVNSEGENIREAQLEMIQYIRKARRAIGIRRQSNMMMSPRSTMQAVFMLAQGFTVAETKAAAVWKGAETNVVMQLVETMDDHFGTSELAPERNVI